MFDEYVPKKKIGYLSPQPMVDNLAYQFYHLAPQGTMFIIVTMGIREYALKDVERILIPLEEYLALLVSRGAHVVVQGGVPLAVLMGLKNHDELLGRMEKASGLPATSTIQNVVAAANALKIKKIAVANKWDSKMNEMLGLFFERGGVRIVGFNTKLMGPAEFLKMKSEDSLNFAYELGKGAFQNHPEADGLYIGGGGWMTFAAVEALEKEFGKPVITNETAVVWGVGHLMNYWKPQKGYGRLMAGL